MSDGVEYRVTQLHGTCFFREDDAAMFGKRAWVSDPYVIMPDETIVRFESGWKDEVEAKEQAAIADWNRKKDGPSKLERMIDEVEKTVAADPALAGASKKLMERGWPTWSAKVYAHGIGTLVPDYDGADGRAAAETTANWKEKIAAEILNREFAKVEIDWEKKIISRDGRVPVILSREGPRPHTRVVGYFVDDGVLRAWNFDGACQPLEVQAGSLANDLINVPPKPVVRWVNVYEVGNDCYETDDSPHMHMSEAEAKGAITASVIHVATVRVEFVPK